MLIMQAVWVKVVRVLFPIFIALIFSFIPTFSQSEQQNYTILLRNMSFIPEPGVDPRILGTLREDGWTVQKLYGTYGIGTVHALAQFTRPPSPDERQELSTKGVHLLSYIPNLTWIVAVPANNPDVLQELKGLRWVGRLEPQQKLSPRFQKGTVVRTEDGHAVALVQFHEDVSLDVAEVILRKYGVRTKSTTKAIKTVVVAVPEEKLLPLANEDPVKWIEPALPPLDRREDREHGDTLIHGPSTTVVLP